jgi:hypothetical protein
VREGLGRSGVAVDLGRESEEIWCDVGGGGGEGGKAMVGILARLNESCVTMPGDALGLWKVGRAQASFGHEGFCLVGLVGR